MLLALGATLIVIVALLWEVAAPRIAEGYERHKARRARVPVDVYDPGRERRAEQRARQLLRSCVNDEEWDMYRELGFIRVWGGVSGGPPPGGRPGHPAGARARPRRPASGRPRSPRPRAPLPPPPSPRTSRSSPTCRRPASCWPSTAWPSRTRRGPTAPRARRTPPPPLARGWPSPGPSAPAGLRRRPGQVDGLDRRRAPPRRPGQHAPARPPGRPQAGPARPLAP